MNPIAAALLFGGESGGSSDPIVASSVTYDNTDSGLEATDVQGAIDEVNEKIEELPKAMLYKGTLGTGGTITSLPTASPSNEGHVYKVKTEGEYPLDSYYYKVTSRIDGSYVVWDCIKAKDSEYTNITKQETLEPQGTGGPLTFDNVLKIVSYPGSSGVTTIEALVDGVIYNGTAHNTGEAIYNTDVWASVWSCSGISYGESIHAKVGDMFISNGAEWTHIPSGDDMVIADEVTYDNTTSDLTATDVNSAIDEVNDKIDNIEITAENVNYDNTDSGLEATDVQGAIDEVISKIGDSYNLNLLETEVDTKMTFLGKKIYALVTDADSPKIEITKSATGVHFAGDALLFPDVSGVKPSWVEIHPEGFAEGDLIYDESRSTTQWYNGRWYPLNLGEYSGSWSFLSINEGGFTFKENYQANIRTFSYIAKFYVDIPNVDIVLLKHEVEDANYIIYLYTKVTD